MAAISYAMMGGMIALGVIVGASILSNGISIKMQRTSQQLTAPISQGDGAGPSDPASPVPGEPSEPGVPAGEGSGGPSDPASGADDTGSGAGNSGGLHDSTADCGSGHFC